MNFEDMVQMGEVVRVRKDLGEARGLRDMAESRLQVVEDAKIKSETLAALFDNLYEGLKSLVISKMAEAGYAPKNHKAIIAFARDVLKLESHEVAFFDAMRVLRNDVVYRGKAVADIGFVERCKNLLLNWLEKI